MFLKEDNMKILNRILKWAGAILSSAIFLLLLFILVAYSLKGIIYKNYYNEAKDEALIPGLSENFSSQGLFINKSTGDYLFSGYMTDKTPSRIYLESKDGAKLKYVNIKNHDGTDCTFHCGGITVYFDNIYLVTDDQTSDAITGLENSINVLSYSDLINANNGDSIIIKSVISSPVGGAFAYIKDDSLFVGEFYKLHNWDSPKSHWYKTQNNEENRALLACYSLDSSITCGIKSIIPEKMYSICNEVQGFALTDSGKAVLSCSYGINSSYLRTYAISEAEKAANDFSVNGTLVPVYILSSSRQTNILKAPPMSEEIDYANGRLFINFESAGKKYRNVNIYPSFYVTSIQID